MHYRIGSLCREQHALGTGWFPLDTGSAERKLSAQGTRHRPAGKELCAESPNKSSQHTCAERHIQLSAETFEKH
jgi:hypothetical protein